MHRFLSALIVSAVACSAQVSITTNYGNNSRTGWNQNETSLNTSNVKSGGFGKLFSYTVDGSVYAQPLYVPNVTIGGAAHNVLLVATMYDSVYAFDADQNTTLWHVSFINPAAGITPVNIVDITGLSDSNIVGWVGVEGTPVIDPSTLTVYLVARTTESVNSTATYVQRLHALDLTTGQEKFGGPVVIAGSVPGTGENSQNGSVLFSPFWQNQRPGLALANGQVIISWASHEDDQPYHGWVMAYNASTLAQTGIFCDTPNGGEGGIWMSGRAPIVDARGNLYLATGNSTDEKKTDFGESYLKFSTAAGGLALTDYFTASNAVSLNDADEDLASSGPFLIPKTHMFVGGGKQGVLYLIDTNNLGQYAANDTQIPQKFQAVNNLIFSGPAYWESASKGPMLFIWAQNDYLRGFPFNGSTFATAPSVLSTVESPSGANPGGALSISSSGTSDSTGIVWASMPINQDEWHGLATGWVRAVNATTGAELWNSQMVAGDSEGAFCAKFVPPTVANGKVYMATFTDYNSPNYVDVYGLLTASPQFTLAASPSAGAILPGGTATFTVSVGPIPEHSFNGTVNLSVRSLPPGITAAFNPATLKGAGSSTLTLTASQSVALGTNTLVMVGKSALNAIQTTTVPLSVIHSFGAISVNFVGDGTELSASNVAGVAPKANWNNIAGAQSQSPVALSDENGAVTPVTVTWIADNPWALPTQASTPDEVMMQGYLDDVDVDSTLVNFTGLPTAADGYTVYVYCDGDNGSDLRSANYTLSGAGFTSQTLLAEDPANTNFNGTYRQVTASKHAGNYMVFTIPGGNFQLTATPANGGPRAPVNGIQIVPNP